MSEFLDNAQITHLLGRTLVLAKTLDDFQDLYVPGETYSIASYRASVEVQTMYPKAQVFNRSPSSWTDSSRHFFNAHLFNNWKIDRSIADFEYVLPYQSYYWCGDCEFAGCKAFAIPYYLFLLLSNKISQLETLVRRSCDIPDLPLNLSKYQQLHSRHLGTRFMFKDDVSYSELKSLYGHEYVVAAANSDGGKHVYLVRSDRDFEQAILHIVGPVIRIERYLKQATPITQTAIVFDRRLIVKYLPSVMIMHAMAKPCARFLYQGNDFSINKTLTSSQQRVLDQVSTFTHTLGAVLDSFSFRGVFNVDYLVTEDGRVFFMEVNPRFGSSNFLISMAVSRSGRTVCSPYILHMLAHLSIGREIRTFLDEYAVADSMVNPFGNGAFVAYIQEQDVCGGTTRHYHNSNGRDDLIAYSMLKQSIVESPCWQTGRLSD